MAENALWWEGPAWIKKEEDQWPRIKFDNRPDELPERRTTQSEGGGVVSAVNTQRDEGTSQPKGDKTWNQLYRKRGNMRRYIYKQLYYGKTISSFDALRPLFSSSFLNFICRHRPEVLNRGHVKQRGLNRFFTALFRFAAIPHC